MVIKCITGAIFNGLDDVIIDLSRLSLNYSKRKTVYATYRSILLEVWFIYQKYSA